MKEMRMALPCPSLKVPFWEAFRPGSSMPSAAPDPGPLLQAPSPQLPGLGLGEEEGEEAVPLGNIPAEVGRCGCRLGRSPCALAVCALPRLKAPKLTAHRRLAPPGRAQQLWRARLRLRPPGASPSGSLLERCLSCSSGGPGHTGEWRGEAKRLEPSAAHPLSGKALD